MKIEYALELLLLKEGFTKQELDKKFHSIKSIYVNSKRNSDIKKLNDLKVAYNLLKEIAIISTDYEEIKINDSKLPRGRFIKVLSIVFVCLIFLSSIGFYIYIEITYQNLVREINDLDAYQVDYIESELNFLPNFYKNTEEIYAEFQLIDDDLNSLDMYWGNYIEPESVPTMRNAYYNLVEIEDELEYFDISRITNDYQYALLNTTWYTLDGEYYFRVRINPENYYKRTFDTNLPSQRSDNLTYNIFSNNNNSVYGYYQPNKYYNRFESYAVTVVNKSYIKVFCFQNEQTYTLYK